MARKKNRYEVAAKKAHARNPHRIANPEFAAAMRDLGRSNAAAPHVAKSRKGTRAAHKSRAMREFA